MFNNQFPYMDIHELNLDWIIKECKRLAEEMKSFKAINDIKYLGSWNINNTYEPWSVVTDSGYAYMSIKAVPAGIQIDNNEYWVYVSQFQIDNELSLNSVNPVENRVITSKFSLIDTNIDELNAELDVEETAREAVNNALTAETNARIAADNTLTSDLNSEITSRASADNLINARIDEILEGASVDPDAELLDIRVGYNSKTYASAGDAVRGQVEDLHDIYDAVVSRAGDPIIFTDNDIVTGLLNADGSIDSTDATWRTVDYIDITGYTSLYFGYSNYDGTTYTLFLCEYNSSKALIGSRQALSPVNDIWAYTLNPSTKYVRLSVSKSKLDTGTFEVRGVNDIFKKINFALNNSAVLDLVSIYGWQSNYIVNNTGNIQFASGFNTIGGYIPVNEGDIITFENQIADFTCFLCTYAADRSLVRYSSDPVSFPVSVLKIPSGVSYIRFSVSNGVINTGVVFKKYSKYLGQINDFTELINNVNSYFDNTAFNYYGEQLDLTIPNGFGMSGKVFAAASVEPDGYTGQGCDSYGNTLFQFFADDLVRLYDMDSSSVIANISGTFGHGNTASFSNEFASAGDDFPLIYVSDTAKSKVYVNKITTSTATLVRTLSFDPSVFGYNPQVVFDKANFNTYVVCNLDESPYVNYGYKISKVNMSSLTDNGDGTYTPTVIETFTVNITETNVIFQGCKCFNNRIYLASGGYNTAIKSKLLIINTESKSLTGLFTNFTEPMYSDEFEDITFIPDNAKTKYVILAHVRSNGYYKLYI